MMTSLKIFFEAHKYLTNCVKNSIKALDKKKLEVIFDTLIKARNFESSVIVDGQGRSLQSMLIMEDCLEHNGFPIIFPANNANLRPWKKDDVFFFNTGSGSGSPLTHAIAARDDGLKVLGMTYNSDLTKEFPEGILLLTPSENKNKLYAPLGTEFEITSASIGACLGYSVCDTVEESLECFENSSNRFMELFCKTYGIFEDNLDGLIHFINLIDEYIEPENKNHTYFMGVGRDSIINQVAAIRYGHLHKMQNEKVVQDLRVIYDGHWDLRKPGDLAIITSGSGSTSQTLNYATQAFISGMKVFGITSFSDSDLGKFSNRCDGCLVVPGRRERFSMFNMVSQERLNYLPEFELNLYLTMDALLAQIANDHDISESDMKASHRSKVLE